MIPRTDQFRKCPDGSLDIRGVAQPLDLLTYLLIKLDTFLGLCGTLPRGSDGAYLQRDPRAGRLTSVRASWSDVQMAAQLVWSSTLVSVNFHRTAPDIAIAGATPAIYDVVIADLAKQLIFAVVGSESELAIPAVVIDRIRNVRDQLEPIIMPIQVEALEVLQTDLHRWVRGTRGARAWIEKTIVPQLAAMWKKQQQLRRKQARIDSAHRARWVKARESGHPFDERPRVIYDRDLDPRNMSAETIGRLRDEDQRELADLAEAYFVVMLHDSGEAGNLCKLCPLLGKVEGLSHKFDWAYLDRMDTGLERDDTAPRFSPGAVEGMIERFKARFDRLATEEQVSGVTMKTIRDALGIKSATTLQTMFKDAGIPQPESGDSHKRFGRHSLEKLLAHCRSHSDSRRRKHAPKIEALLTELAGT